MKAPKKLYEGRYTGSRQWDPPDKEWFYDQYWIQEKSTNQIAQELNCRAGIVLRWLYATGISIRSPQECSDRHSYRMSGKGNPAYVDGTDSGASSKRCRGLLWALDVSEVCAWCGVPASVERLEAHHKDHNRRNEKGTNLQWLCVTCHRFESYLWRLLKQGKIDLECDGESRTMVIQFKK